jgi:hypothetical protein
MNRNPDKKHSLKNLSVEEIKLAYEKQKKNGDWTFYQEREFVENLLQTRFNFLITVYTLFLLPFFQANEKVSKIIILLLGLFIVGIMGLAVYRVYVKFDIIMKILNKLDEHHVFLIQGKEFKKRIKLFASNPFIGYVIPIFLFVSIILMGILLIVFDFKLQ